MTDRVGRLRQAGVSIWLDVLSRDLLESGEFAALVRDRGVSGVTSNPTIFAKAIATSDRYDNQLRAALAAGVHNSQELFLELGLEDIRRAAAILGPVHRASGTARMASSRSNARPTSPAPPTPRSRRPRCSGNASICPTS